MIIPVFYHCKPAIILRYDRLRTYIIQLNNINIAEHIIGEGEPILFLHGWGANIGLVLPLAESLAQKGYRLLSAGYARFWQK